MATFEVPMLKQIRTLWYVLRHDVSLSNRATAYIAAAGHSPSFAMGPTPVPPTPLHRTSASPRAPSGTISFQRRVFAGNPYHRREFPVPQAAPPKSIMSTVLPNTPFQKSKEQMLGFCGYLRQNKGAHHEHQQGLGSRKASRKTP